MTRRPGIAVWLDAVRDSDLDRTAVLTAAMLATWMGRKGMAWPSRQTIANACRFRSLRTVDGALNRLEKSGYLRVEHSRGRTPNRYYIALPTGHSAASLLAANGAMHDVQRCISHSATAHPVAAEVQEVREIPRRARAEVRVASRIAEICLDCGEPFTTSDQDEVYCHACAAANAVA
jgi:hypothetical protein